jgi:hypothetical protein
MMGTLRATIRATRCATHLVADNSSLSGRGFCAPALLALYSPDCVEQEFCELRLEGGSEVLLVKFI